MKDFITPLPKLTPHDIQRIIPYSLIITYHQQFPKLTSLFVETNCDQAQLLSTLTYYTTHSFLALISYYKVILYLYVLLCKIITNGPTFLFIQCLYMPIVHCDLACACKVFFFLPFSLGNPLAFYYSRDIKFKV